MGKKRIAVLGEENQAEKKKEKKVAPKSGKEHGKIADVGAEALAEASVIEEKTKEIEKESEKEAKKETKKAKKERKRGKKYQEAKKKIDPNQFYPLSEAIKLLKSTSISQFKGNLDVHLNVKEIGLKGEVEFPHPTGKKQNIRIADETLLQELEKGKIDFTQLVASAKMMPKLVKYARLLGPKGLMPSPKNGTITEDPQSFIKNAAGKVQFKTEPKFPLIHLSLGKIEAPEKDLADNFKALMKAVGRKNIQKATLSPTMGPGAKVDLSSIND
jgi:large subunit ribosomal protein L1